MKTKDGKLNNLNMADSSAICFSNLYDISYSLTHTFPAQLSVFPYALQSMTVATVSLCHAHKTKGIALVHNLS